MMDRNQLTRIQLDTFTDLPRRFGLPGGQLDEGMRQLSTFLAWSMVLLVWSLLSPPHLAGQNAVPAPAAPAPEAEEADQITERVFLPPDRSIRQLLDRAEQLLNQQRFSEAVQALQTVLNAPEDYFYRPEDNALQPGGQTYRSIKSEARRLIGKLPPGGRRSYDLQYGPAARRKLQEAVAAGNMEGVAEVSRRYCHTEAAEEALILLGRYHLDQGRPLAAALCIEQVHRTATAAAYEPELSLLLAACWARAGEPEKAAVLLEQVRRRWPDAKAPDADHPDQLVLLSRKPADQWIAAWSSDLNAVRPPEEQEWNLFLGNPARIASAAGGRPLTLRPCWRQRVAIEASAEEAIASQARQLFDQSTPSVPALNPLALGEVVLMRGAGRLAAIDIQTGKIVWQTEPTEDVRSPSTEGEVVSEPPEPGRRSRSAPLEVWGDRTRGTISSDGDAVYAIEQPGVEVAGRGRQWVDPFGRRRNISAAEASLNVLAAYEVRTTPGKQRWQVGGPTGVEPKLQKAFFLGPPLPLQGWLYAIAETGGEVRLVVLSAETGRLQWSQQLAVADDEIARDPARYRSGISPSFADGVLVCPTTAGAVVAIDLATRGLLWGYQYPRDAVGESVRDPFAPFIRRSSASPDEAMPTGWRDSCPMVSAGRVVITPAESNQLHCLRLDNGQLEWKAERGDHVYVAGVHDGRLLLIGPEEVTAIELTGMRRGQTAATLPLPSGALPSGRGCYTGTDYYLPLLTATGAEIARLDLNAWKFTEHIPCRDGSAPGNLISYRGRIFSQGPDFLQCYHQLDALKRQVERALAKDANDPAALTQQAQILLDEGNATKALPILRQAYATYTKLAEEPQEKDTSPVERSRRNEALAERVPVRELLVDGLLEHLKSHFQDRQTVSQELTRLIDQPEERVRFLRIVAEGLAAAGDTAGAMDNYFKLVELAGDGSQWVSADPAHQTRLDRWLAARLGTLPKSLTGSLGNEYSRRVADRFKRLASGSAEDLLISHVTIFDKHPTADLARLRLAAQKQAPESLLERVHWLYSVVDHADDAISREATARLALLLLEAERTDDAAVFYRRLVDRWPNTPCLEGRTGRQLFDGLPTGSPARKQPGMATPWPLGAVKAAQSSGESRYPLGYQPAAELVTGGRQAGEPLRVFLDVQQQLLSGLDSLGRAKWRLPLARDIEGNPFMVNRGLAAGRFDRHVLILSLGTHVMAINTLKPSGPRGQGLLWMDECGSAGLAGGAGEAERTRPWEDDEPDHRDYGETLAQLGPVVAGGATYLRSRELVSVDPIGGQRLWSRRDVPAGSELFGDDEMLVAAPPQGDALILQSVDGTLLGRRKVPAVDDRWFTVGRNIVCLEHENGKPQWLRLFDPWTQKNVWRWPLGDGVKMAVVDETTVAVLDRHGQFMLLDLTTGLPRFRRQLQAEPALSGLYVLPGRENLIVIANRRRPEATGMLVESAHENGGPIISGRIFALSRETGEPLWPSPALVEDFALVLEQPRDLPVAVFARRASERDSGRQQTSFLFLDKRTGALATPVREFTRRISNFEMVGDDEKKTVALHLRSAANTLVLTFTGDPAPPEPPFQAVARRTEKKESGDVLGTALRELGKAVQKLAQPPADKKQQEKDLFGE